VEEAESRPDPQKPAEPDVDASEAAGGSAAPAEAKSEPRPAPRPLPEAESIFGRDDESRTRRRVLNPWIGSAAAILVVLACGAAVQSPFSMVSAHRVPTSDLPRLSDPAPPAGSSVDGGGPGHFELPPPVVPAAGVGAPTSPPATGATATPGASGTPGATPAGTRGTNATGTGGIPQTVLSAYESAASNLARMDPGCKLPWSLLAGIGRVESEHAYGGNVTADGTAVTPILGPRLDGAQFARIADTDGGRYDFDTEYDRAVGPMQFIPSTWKSWGMDGNRDGQVNPQNIFDATLAAGRYLCAGNRDLSTDAGLTQAILSYNHSDEYVRTVKSWMTYYATGARAIPDAPKPPKKSATSTPKTTPTKRPGTSPETPSVPPVVPPVSPSASTTASASASASASTSASASASTSASASQRSGASSSPSTAGTANAG
jgi:membrane-bound lytic murein transglycosylase B